MSSLYPGALDSIPPVADGDLITATQQNARSDAINAIESTLGTNPAGSSATVGAAIAARAPLDSPAMIGTPTAPTAAGGTSTTQIATTAFVQASAVVVAPTGTVTIYAGSSAPTGWLLCDGASELRADYAGLFAVIGVTYGSADGTHFNVPDLRGRVVIGVSASHTLATTGGEEAHTLTSAESGLVAHGHNASQSAHTHTDTGHTHPIPYSALVNPSYAGLVSGSACYVGGTSAASTSSGSATLVSVAPTITVNTSDSSSATSGHNNMQPFLTMNYIIKT